MEQQQLSKPQAKKPASQLERKLKLDSWRSSSSPAQTNKLLPLGAQASGLANLPNELRQEPHLTGQQMMMESRRCWTPPADLVAEFGAKQVSASSSSSSSWWKLARVDLRPTRRKFQLRVMTNSEYPPRDKRATPSLTRISLDDHDDDADEDDQHHTECGRQREARREGTPADTGNEPEWTGKQDQDIHRRQWRPTLGRQSFMLQEHDHHHRHGHRDATLNTLHHRHRHKHYLAGCKQTHCRYNHSQSFRLNYVMKIIIMIAILVINSVAHFNCLQVEQQYEQQQQPAHRDTNRHPMADIWPGVGVVGGQPGGGRVSSTPGAANVDHPERQTNLADRIHLHQTPSRGLKGVSQGDESNKGTVLTKLDDVGGVNKIEGAKKEEAVGAPEVSARNDEAGGSQGARAGRTGEPDTRQLRHVNVAEADVAAAKNEDHDNDMMAVPDDDVYGDDDTDDIDGQEDDDNLRLDAAKNGSSCRPGQAERHTQAELDDYNDYGTYIIYEEPANGAVDDHEHTSASESEPPIWPGSSSGDSGDDDHHDHQQHQTTSHQSLQRIFYAAKSEAGAGQHLQWTSSMILNNKSDKRNDSRPAGDRQEHEPYEMIDSVPVGGAATTARIATTSTTTSATATSKSGYQSDINHQVQGAESPGGAESKATSIRSAPIRADTPTGDYLTFKFPTAPNSALIVQSAGSSGGPQLLSATYQAAAAEAPTATAAAGEPQNTSRWSPSSSSSSSSRSAPSSSAPPSQSTLGDGLAESAKPSAKSIVSAATRLRRHRDNHRQDAEAETSTHSALDSAQATVTQRQRPSKVNTSSNNGGPPARQGRRVWAQDSFHVDGGTSAPTSPPRPPLPPSWQPARMVKVRQPQEEEGEANSLSSAASVGLSVGAELDEEDVKWLNKMNEKSLASGAAGQQEAPSAGSSSSGSSDNAGRDHDKGPLSWIKQTLAAVAEAAAGGTSGPRTEPPGNLASDLFAGGQPSGLDDERTRSAGGRHLGSAWQPAASEWMNNQAPPSLLLHQADGSPEGHKANNGAQQSDGPNQGSSSGGGGGGDDPAASHMQLRQDHQRQRHAEPGNEQATEAPNHNHGDDDDGGGSNDADHHHLNGTNAGPDSPEQEEHNIYYWRLIWFILPLGATFGNLLVIMAVHRERSLQSVTNYFIVSLAFADLFVGLIVMPFAVYVLVSNNIDNFALLTVHGYVCRPGLARRCVPFLRLEDEAERWPRSKHVWPFSSFLHAKLCVCV